MTGVLAPYAAVYAGATVIVACGLAFGVLRVSGAMSAYLLARAELRRLEARAKTRELDPPKPICGCGHHISFHDRETSSCHRQDVGESTFFNRVVACDCQRYTGPEPLPTLYAPDV